MVPTVVWFVVVVWLTSRKAIRGCFEMVTNNAAKVLGLEAYGLEIGNNADMVILQAKDPIEAIRLRANRLKVIRRGKIIAENPPRKSFLHLSGRPASLEP